MATTPTPTPTILMLDIPPSALCGIDLLSFTSSPKFHGIKNLPPGLHFVFTGATKSLSIRHGVWFLVEDPASHPAELFVKQWDEKEEVLVAETDEAEILRWRANLGSIWEDGLTPYRQSAGGAAGGDAATERCFVEEKRDWARLTDRVGVELLGRVTGGRADEWHVTSASSAKVDEDVIPGLSARAGQSDEGEKELNFVPVDLKQTWPPGAVGRARTEAAKDRSWALETIVRTHCSGGDEMELVGEMQLTFLMALVLGNYSCLEQWKRILSLVLTCQSATKTMPRLFTAVLATVKLQLQHCNDVEGGIFDVTGEGGQMLKQLLRGFGRGLVDTFGDAPSPVRLHFKDLEGYVRSELGWELGDSYVRSGMLELEDGEQVEMEVDDLEGEDERGEYAPVVVDMEPLRGSPDEDHDDEIYD